MNTTTQAPRTAEVQMNTGASTFKIALLLTFTLAFVHWSGVVTLPLVAVLSPLLAWLLIAAVSLLAGLLVAGALVLIQVVSKR